MASIVFDISDVVKKLKVIDEKHSDMTPMFKMIAEFEKSQTLLRYKDEVAPDGTKWRNPIAIRRDGTATPNRMDKSRAWHYWKFSNFKAVPKGWHTFDRGLGDKTLRDTGVLMNSIQEKFGKDFAMVGTNIKYGQYVTNLGFNFLGVNNKTISNVRKAYSLFMRGKS